MTPDAPTALGGDSWRWPEMLQSTAIAFLVGAICIMPRLVPWLLVILAVLYAVPKPSHAHSLLRQAFAGVAPVATLALPGLGVLSTLWAADRTVAINTAGTALCLAVATLFLLAATRSQFDQLTPLWRRRFLRAIPLGGLAGLAFLLFELATRNALSRGMLTRFPVLMGDRGKGLTISDGTVSDVAGYFINRNVAGVTILAIPVLLAIWLWLEGSRRAAVMGAVVMALLLVVFGSDSETAKLALVLGTLAIVLAHRWPRKTMFGLAAALVLGLGLTQTFARLPFQLGLHQAAWLPYSHRDRVLIWDYSAEVAARHPVLGAGVEASRALQQATAKEKKPSGPVVETRRAGWHAHNFYLQTRLELGIVGSLAALVFGLAMLAAASRLHARLVPWGYGLVAATMASAISGWGLWQYWFLAGLGANAVFLALIDAHVRQQDRTETEAVA
jgi:hypothetical protein